MIWSRPLRSNDWRGRLLRSCIGARERSWNERPLATARGPLFFGRARSTGRMLEIASAHFGLRVPARSIFSRSACRAMPRRRLNASSAIASPTSNAFLVLSRLASSLQMCGLWEESKGVLHKSRQLQAKTAPNANTHDDVEFALFEARWRASRERSSLIDELKACAGTSDASPSHRVGCGLLGLKIAAGENQIDAVEELYLTMVPLLENPKIAATTRLEVEMIYHSTCGDVRKAERAADQLLVAVGDEPDPRMRARALLNAGTAYRIVGRVDDAEAVLLELMDYSVAHGYLNRASFASLALARVYLAAGDLPRTRATLQKLETLTGDEQDHLLTRDRLYMFARLALDEGNVEEAAERYAVLAAQTSKNESVNWQAAALAVAIRIGIARHASTEMLGRTVAGLEAAHLQNRGWGSQDFEAHALALGLRYCGELEKGRLLFADYVRTYRREKWALPKYLRDLLRELQDSYAVSVTLKRESLSGAV